jgi:alpha-galactosidase/6-phospho-beta-glucosidase family protein
MDAYARGDRHAIECALSSRQADWYEMAVGPLLAAQAGGIAEEIFFLSIPQGGWCAAFDREDVLEIPHVMGNLLEPIYHSAPAPAEILNRLRPFVRYERAAATAVCARDQNAIEQALAIHPWTTSQVSIKALAARVCATIESQA